jgi:hypothetical protein
MNKGMIETYDPDSKEAREQADKAIAYLMSLRKAAHQNGLKYYTPDEIEAIWAEERAGGEGLNRVWNY